MVRLGDATWHLKSVTLGIKGMAHIEPHGCHKKNYEIKEKEGKRESHTFGLRKEGSKFPLFDRMSGCSKKGEKITKGKEKMRRK